MRFTPANNVLGNLTLNKSAAGDVNLGNNLDICTQLNLTQGKIILGSNNLRLLSGARTTNGNANSYSVTLDQASQSGAGYFVQEMPSGGGPRTFPIGSPSSYTPAYLNNTGATRFFQARVFDNAFENGTSGAMLGPISTLVRKTWDISPQAGAGTPNTSVELQWNASDEGADFTTSRMSNPGDIYISKNQNGPSGTWETQVVASRQLSTGPFTMKSNPITTFSTFTVSSYVIPVPVSMGTLAVRNMGKENLLTWATYSERDAKGFAILQSPDGKTFSHIGFVAAAGHSDARLAYSFAHPATGRRVYYRIQFQGYAEDDRAFSNIVSIGAGAPKATFSLYPNPATDKVYLLGAPDDAQGSRVRITDMIGRRVEVPLATAGNGLLAIDLASYPAGIYRIELLANGNSLGTAQVVKK